MASNSNVCLHWFWGADRLSTHNLSLRSATFTDITLPSISSGYFALRLFSFISIAILISSRTTSVFMLPTVWCFAVSPANLSR